MKSIMEGKLVTRLIDDVRKALNNECYFAALSLALTLPDICGIGEYSKNHPVANRYISWCDANVCQFEKDEHTYSDNITTPYLSGEVIYSLRNTYLHQGCPNLNKAKIKNEHNQIDSFTLIIGEGRIIYDLSMHVDVGNGLKTIKNYMINVTYLCNRICEATEHYFKNNKANFQMDYNIIDEKELIG